MGIDPARANLLLAVLACRTAMDQNVKPEIAVEAMMMTLQRG